MGGLDISITGGAEFITLRYHEQDGNEAALTYVPLRTCYEDKRNGQIKCSECGYPLGVNYCSNCGAKVVRE